MSQLPVLNTLTVVSSKGDRTTGSPLLDSFVLTPTANSTAYLSQEFAKKVALDRFGLSSRLFAFNSSFRINLEVLPVALSSANLQSRSLEIERPIKVAPTSRNKLDSAAQRRSSLATDTQSTDSKNFFVQRLASQISADQDSADLEVATKETVSAAVNPESQTDERLSIDAAKTADVADVEALREGLPPSTFDPKTVSNSLDSPISEFSVAKAVVSMSKLPRRRLPNPSLERAAAVGMLDLSDKLLFGGEDDELISTYLGGDDLLATEDDERVVFKYLSQQIAASTLTKVKSRLPLAVQPEFETEPSKVVLDAKNFKVVAETVLAIDSSKSQSSSERACDKSTDEAERPDEQTFDMTLMSQQIAHLNQKVETLSRELLSLTVAIPQSGHSDSDQAA